MTEKGLREIKRRFSQQRSNIPSISGCLVNGNKEIAARISQSMALSESSVSEMLLKVLKKSLSGSLGTNLLDISFSTKQVSDGKEHALLSELRNSKLKNQEALEEYYKRVIDSVSFDGNYVILVANDVYDVFSKNASGEEESVSSFSYIVSVVCPLKKFDGGLCFRAGDSLFHTLGANLKLANPEMGFMFPAFQDRAANIYGALYYTRSLSDIHEDFVKNIFDFTPPQPPTEQKASFGLCLKDSFKQKCDLDMIKTLHDEIREMVASHKDTKSDDPLTLNKASLKTLLDGCGTVKEDLDAFGEAIDKSFGANAEISPKNLVNVKKFELKTPDVTIKVNPEKKDLVHTEIIDGVKYIMIKATEGVEVGGINIDIN